MRLCTLLLSALLASSDAVAAPPMRSSRFVVTRRSSPEPMVTTGRALASSAKGLSDRVPYVLGACASSGVLRAASDAVSQSLRGVPFDPAHSLAMGTVGILFSGLIGSSWLLHLEDRMGSGNTPVDVVKKSAADFLCYAPCANSAYLFFVPFLTLLYSQGAIDVASSLAAVEHGFVSAMALELSIFAPYNLLSFKLVPAAIRAHTTAAACFGYTVVLSTLC